jgi:hypothetical protein
LENGSKSITILRNGLLANYSPGNVKLQEKISQYCASYKRTPANGNSPTRELFQEEIE